LGVLQVLPLTFLVVHSITLLLGAKFGPLWASVAGGAVLVFVLRYVLRRHPQDGFQRLPLRQRSVRFVGCSLLSASSVGALLGGAIASWETGTDHYRPSTSPDRLFALANRVPEVLQLDSSYYYRHPPNVVTLRLVALLLVWGGALFLGVTGKERNWKVLLASPALLLLGSASAWALGLFNEHRAFKYVALEGSAQFEADALELRSILRAVCEQQVYELLLEVARTSGGVLAKPSDWDARWRADRDGPERLAPGLLFELENRPDGATCLLSWDAGEVISNERLIPVWRSQHEGLLAEARRRLELR